ncbi:hypothetical protein [Shewanella xiamenensis]|uniref:hypothetical protein n=1 Tax=Shewanella xiamenensis TaxID=332186 RepID=UPI00117CBB43|nr:hypothetical protein [Shewanella xiamenensis]
MIKWFRQKLHLDNKMREANILQHSLHQYCPELHLKRLNSLMLASKALIECKTCCPVERLVYAQHGHELMR